MSSILFIISIWQCTKIKSNVAVDSRDDYLLLFLC
nr:MAG TPA: hypothetical protein [Crassvirales sp.]